MRMPSSPSLATMLNHVFGDLAQGPGVQGRSMLHDLEGRHSMPGSVLDDLADEFVSAFSRSLPQNDFYGLLAAEFGQFLSGLDSAALGDGLHDFPRAECRIGISRLDP